LQFRTKIAFKNEKAINYEIYYEIYYEITIFFKLYEIKNVIFYNSKNELFS